MRINKDHIPTVLYKYAIEEELEWRKEKTNASDVAIVEEMLCEIRCLGFGYKYLADITHRDNTDKEMLDILLRYIGRFSDEWISAVLVSVVGIKGNISVTDAIIKNYANSTAKNKQMNSGYYDNALWRIKDKRYISEYLTLLKNPDEAIRFPLTMIMLAKWHIVEAKPVFLKYLNYSNDELVSLSIEALSYYPYDETIIKAIEKNEKSHNKDLITVAKKARKRLERNGKASKTQE
jgi:hypothetical protein